MIPKLIHFYWGNQQMSFLRYMTLYSFRKLHPDWEIRLVRRSCKTNKRKRWITHETQDAFNYNNAADYTDRLVDLNITFVDFDFPEIDQLDIDMTDVHISDLLGWYNLATYGGINADMDILFTKNIDSLIDSYNARDVHTGILMYKESTPPPYDKFPRADIYPIGFLIGSVENEFWRQVYQAALKAYDSNQYQCMGASLLRQVINELLAGKAAKLEAMRFASLPPYLVYPFAPNPEIYFYEGIKMLWLGDHRKKIPESTIGIHWYGGDVITQQFNNSITEQNYKTYNNIICNTIKEIYT